MLNKMGTMEVDLSDDEDNEEKSATNETHVKAMEDSAPRGNYEDDDETLKEFSMWKLLVIGVILGYIGLNWKDWAQYFMRSDDA